MILITGENWGERTGKRGITWELFVLMVSENPKLFYKNPIQ